MSTELDKLFQGPVWGSGGAGLPSVGLLDRVGWSSHKSKVVAVTRVVCMQFISAGNAFVGLDWNCDWLVWGTE